MLNFLKLIRYPNLLFILYIQLCVKFALFIPSQGESSFMFNIDFLLVMLLSLLVTAGAYIYNDISDKDSDSHNKKRWMYLSEFGIKNANITVKLMFSIAIIIVLYLCYTYNDILIPISLVIAIVLLLLSYSKIKRLSGLWANMLVSLLSVSVIFVVWYLELAQQQSINADIHNLIIFFCVFSFLVTIPREIIKDIEDMVGDKQIARRTLPLIYGVFKTKNIVLACNVISFLALTYIMMTLLKKIEAIVYFSLVFYIPMIFLSYKTIIASDTKHFSDISRWYKYVMVLGVSYLIIYSIN